MNNGVLVSLEATENKWSSPYAILGYILGAVAAGGLTLTLRIVCCKRSECCKTSDNSNTTTNQNTNNTTTSTTNTTTTTNTSATTNNTATANNSNLATTNIGNHTGNVINYNVVYNVNSAPALPTHNLIQLTE